MRTGERIRAARKKRRITQKALASQLGLSEWAIAQWENGHRNPKPETLERLAAAMGCSVTELRGADSGAIDYYLLAEKVLAVLHSKYGKLEVFHREKTGGDNS